MVGQVTKVVAIQESFKAAREMENEPIPQDPDFSKWVIHMPQEEIVNL